MSGTLFRKSHNYPSRKRPHGDSGVHGSPDSAESAGKQSGGSTNCELAIVDGGLGEAHV